jgi:hypothetical protein
VYQRLALLALSLVLPAYIADYGLPLGSRVAPLAVNAALVACLLAAPSVAISGGVGVAILGYAWFALIPLVRDGWVRAGVVEDELLVGAALLLLGVLTQGILDSHARWHRFLRLTAYALVTVASIAAIGGLWKLSLLVRFEIIEALRQADGGYPPGTALRPDYNVYALCVVMGLAATLWLAHNLPRRTGRLAFLSLLASFMIAAILLSSSRRGAVFALLVLLLAETPWWRLPTSTALPIHWRLAPLLVLAISAPFVLSAVTARAGQFGVSTDALVKVFDRLSSLQSPEQAFSTRQVRIEWAMKEAERSYGVADLLVGRGFTFLSDMGREFANYTGIDYPHVFLLSSLLHGGLALVLLQLAFIWLAARALWQHRREAGFLLPLFLLALIFALSSSNGLYSNEVLTFISILVVAVLKPLITTPPALSGNQPSAGRGP